MKKISIIVPYYNSDLFISELLQSFAAQTHKALELIVINDGSNPKSVDTLEHELQKYRHRFETHLIHQTQNLGAAQARNLGLQRATGEYLSFIDADDVLCGKYSLEYRYDFLESHSDFDATAGYSVMIGQDSKILFPDSKPSSEFLYSVSHPDNILKQYCTYAINNTQNFISVFFLLAGSCLLKSSSAKKFEFQTEYDTEEDIEWTLRFLQSGNRVQLHKLPFHFRRHHPNQYHLETSPQISRKVLKKMAEILR